MGNEFDAIKNRMENIPQVISDKVKSKFDKIDAQQNKIKDKAEVYAEDKPAIAPKIYVNAFIAGANEVIQQSTRVY